MDIKLHEIPVRDIVNGYKDSQEEGVVAYGGLLDVRPKYQREFVYDEKKRNAVIDTVLKDFPLNVMYWAVNGDGTYEVIDGQQRTLSICQYVNGDFSIKDDKGNPMYFHTLKPDMQELILGKKLMIYFCEGSETEKLGWFETVNIAGERLTKQELRNSVFCGDWLTHAKRYFSKTGCAAVKVGEKYVKGATIKLKGEEALAFIRTRVHDRLDANVTRMSHQRLYMDAFSAQTKTKIANNPEFVVDAFEKVERFLNTDLSVEDVSHLVDDYYDYTVLPMITATGHYEQAENKTAQFFPDEASLWNCVRSAFCVE